MPVAAVAEIVIVSLIVVANSFVITGLVKVLFVNVCVKAFPVIVKSESGTVTVRLAAGDAVIVDVKLVEPPLNAIAMFFP